MPKRKRENDGTSSRVSYGLLLYKIDDSLVNGRISGADRSVTKEHESRAPVIRFLLGLVPQRNWWTVFKGLPEPNETPPKTALREFIEETGIVDAASSLGSVLSSPEMELHTRVGSSKTLSIFLIEGSAIRESSFDVEKVVTIDQGCMKGHPEIVKIRWLTLQEALDGADKAKIYSSQREMIQQAQMFLLSKRDPV